MRTFSTVQPARSATSSVDRPAADQGLDLARAQGVAHLDLELAQPGSIVTGGGTQRLVEGDPVAGAPAVGEQEVPTVLVDADEA